MGKISKEEKKKNHKEEKRRNKDLNRKIPYKQILGIVAIIVPVTAFFVMQRQIALDESFGDVVQSYPMDPDTRPTSCPRGVAIKAPRDSVTIIIPYLDEEWFRIRAAMESIIKYTDMSYIKEILWVADGCKADKIFAKEIQAFHKKVSVIVNEKNKGLIITKMETAARAKGSILMFLEPHIIVFKGWLPPLLNRVVENPKALVMPMMDQIDERMMVSMATHGHWRFEWNMNLAYTNPERIEVSGTEPFMSPGTSGGIYAIQKAWWDSLEFFDPELHRWGGDHIEASFKVWRCGGRIEIHPCSRLAHWFRQPENRPYDVKVKILERNYKRLATVWFDDYQRQFDKLKPHLVATDVGNMTAMIDRRNQMKCKDMDWYIKNVALEMEWEKDQICIPGATWQGGGCINQKPPVPRMTSITDYVPLKDYKALMANADAFKRS